MKGEDKKTLNPQSSKQSLSPGSKYFLVTMVLNQAWPWTHGVTSKQMAVPLVPPPAALQPSAAYVRVSLD